MLLATAQTAGTLAAQITQLNNAISAIQSMSGWALAGPVSFLDNNGVSQEPSLPPLTVAETQTMLNGVVSIYQARLTPLNNQLAGM